MGLRRQPQAIVYAPRFDPGPVPGSGRHTELGKLNRCPEIDFVEHRVQAKRTSLDLARGWPALREAVEALRQIDPHLARAMVKRAVPSPGGSLAATALAFLAALRLEDE